MEMSAMASEPNVQLLAVSVLAGMHFLTGLGGGYQTVAMLSGSDHTSGSITAGTYPSRRPPRAGSPSPATRRNDDVTIHGGMTVNIVRTSGEPACYRLS